MSRTCFLLLAALLCPQFSRAQSAAPSVASPMLGFIFENRPAAMRPVWGVPGAAILGDPLEFGYPVTNALAFPRRGFALTISERDQTVRLTALPDSTVAPVTFTDAIASPDLMVVSPAGSAAALYKQTSGQLQVITGLPANPVVSSRALPASISNLVTDVAVSDDGADVLLSAASALWLFTSDNTAGTVLQPDGTVAFSFRPNSHDVVLATANNDLLLLENAGMQIAPRSIPNPSPVNGVLFSADATRIYVSRPSGVSVFDLNSNAWTEISCACHPQGLYPLGSQNLVRLTDSAQGPIFLLDVSDASQTRIWFVPQGVRHAISRRSAHD